MAIARTRKNKENPHYGFLVSWEPKQAKNSHVKGEKEIQGNSELGSARHGKRADSLAQAKTSLNVKKDIIRSLIVISLILILELVVYLAWTKFGIK